MKDFLLKPVIRRIRGLPKKVVLGCVCYAVLSSYYIYKPVVDKLIEQQRKEEFQDMAEQLAKIDKINSYPDSK